MSENEYEIIPAGENPIDKSGIEILLNQIRPVWKGRNLIQRVNRLLPVDASSACQRLFNAAIHDLKEKILVIGIDLAKEVASNYQLPPINREEDVFEYNISRTIDLAYRIGILTRPEWRRMHRCYQIRRDIEHEDDEYEAVLQDCFYIFKSTIDIVLSKDPIELLRVTDAKDIIECSTNITLSEEFLRDYKCAPKLRQKEINELLISYAYDEDKPDIVRENSVELMRHIKGLTLNTVTIELAGILEDRLGRDEIDLITAKIGYACGAIGYFKKVKLKDFYNRLLSELESAETDWKKQGILCSKIEDVGGFLHCPEKLVENILIKLVVFYIGERSYGPWSRSRPVFFSDSAVPIIDRIIKSNPEKVGKYFEKLRNDKDIKHSCKNTHILRRFESLADLVEMS